jgi:hypothetical protein
MRPLPNLCSARAFRRVALLAGAGALALSLGGLSAGSAGASTAHASALKLPAERTSPTGNFFTLEAYDPPTSAKKPVANFKIKVCTSAHTPADTTIDPALFTLSLTKGAPVAESPLVASKPALGPTPLKPLKCAEGWLGFALAKGKTVAAVDKTISTLEYEYNGKISWDVG